LFFSIHLVIIDEREKKSRTPSYYYFGAKRLYDCLHQHAYIYYVYLENRTNRILVPVKKKKDMLDIMDTYNHDDMHLRYGKNGHFHQMMANRIPKKVRINSIYNDERKPISTDITGDEMYRMT
jgi:hypothetical protein